MPLELIDLYSHASTWTNEKIAGAATQLEARTPCDDWDVRTLLDHMLETQRYFLGAARGEDASPPSPTPPELITDDPAADFERSRDDMLAPLVNPAWWTRPAPRSASRSAISSCMGGTWLGPPDRTTPCPQACRTRRTR